MLFEILKVGLINVVVTLTMPAKLAVKTVHDVSNKIFYEMWSSNQCVVNLAFL